MEKKSRIRIRAIKEDYIDIRIDESTTILGIKEKLKRVEKIPIERQILFALASKEKWFEGKLNSRFGDQLRDTENVKEIIRELNSDEFFFI